jgi:hypothetical protein
LDEIEAFLERHKDAILITLVELLAQQFYFIFHLGSLFADTFYSTDVRLQELVNMDLFIELESAEVLLELE